jgi:hypothetical protein
MGELMTNEWDLSKYQIEAVAQALEAVWGVIQKHEKDSFGTMCFQDVHHVLRQMRGFYNGAGHLLLILKSEKTAKGQIAKITDLCRRVGSFENFANEHKIALTGVAQFLEFVTTGNQLPREVQILAQEAAHVAKRLLSEQQAGSSSEKISHKTPCISHSPKLSSTRYRNMIRLLRQKSLILPVLERESVERLLFRGEQQFKELKTAGARSSAYKDTVNRIIEKIDSIQNLSEQGKDFKYWLETQVEMEIQADEH